MLGRLLPIVTFCFVLGAVSALSLSILGVVPPAAFGVKFGEVAAVARSESRVVVLEGELVPMPAMLCRDGWRLIDVAVVSGSPPEGATGGSRGVGILVVDRGIIDGLGTTGRLLAGSRVRVSGVILWAGSDRPAIVPAVPIVKVE